MMLAAVYGIVVVALSAVSFAVYGFDKRRAVTGGRRVPEQTLHLLGFLGGWPGAWLARRHFRHKTRKLPFRIVFGLVVVMHLTLVAVVAYAVIRWGTADTPTVSVLEIELDSRAECRL